MIRACLPQHQHIATRVSTFVRTCLLSLLSAAKGPPGPPVLTARAREQRSAGLLPPVVLTAWHGAAPRHLFKLDDLACLKNSNKPTLCVYA